MLKKSAHSGIFLKSLQSVLGYEYTENEMFEGVYTSETLSHAVRNGTPGFCDGLPSSCTRGTCRPDSETKL